MVPNVFKYLKDCWTFKKCRQNSRPVPMEDCLELPIKALLSHMSVQVCDLSYFGVPTLKCPTDYWIYRELIYKIKPDYIVELGNAYGGSLLSMAHLCDQMNHGSLIGVDIDHSNVHTIVKRHKRIDFITNDAYEAVSEVKQRISGAERVLVIEDSLHTYDYTLKLLQAYGNLVTKDSYFIVEDTVIGHGFPNGGDKSPYEAVHEYLKLNDSYEVDRSMEKFILTMNPCGFLKKVK